MSSAAAIGPMARDFRPAGPAVRGLYDLGRELFDQEQYESAGLALQRRLRLAPDDAAARRLLALSLLRTGQTRRAAEALEQSRDTAAIDPDLCLELGEALIADDAKTAQRWLARAAKARPDDEIARRRLAEVDAVLEGESRRNGRHRLERRSWALWH